MWMLVSRKCLRPSRCWPYHTLRVSSLNEMWVYRNKPKKISATSGLRIISCTKHFVHQRIWYTHRFSILKRDNSTVVSYTSHIMYRRIARQIQYSQLRHTSSKFHFRYSSRLLKNASDPQRILYCTDTLWTNGTLQKTIGICISCSTSMKYLMRFCRPFSVRCLQLTFLLPTLYRGKHCVYV